MRQFNTLGRVALILSLAVTFLWLGPGSVLLAETVNNESMAADFMALSGLDNQIRQMPRWYAILVDQVFAGLERGGHRIPGKTKHMVRQTFLDAMDGDVLQKEVRHRLDRELPEDVAKPTVAWLRTDLGRRITALENEATSPESSLQQAAFAMQLQLEPPSPERMQLTRRLEEATGSSDQAVEGWEIVAVALGVAMTAGTPNGRADGKDVLRERLAKLRPDMKTLLLQASLRHMLFTYRTLTDQELGRYVEFLESETGRTLTRIVNGVVIHVASSAVERMEATVTDSLARNRQKTGV
ncbi:MAG TPA: hypothetical protein VFP04_02060 [Nitrospira sp.]|nr:hypothetical protein [Nitrospira sp.]